MRTTHSSHPEALKDKEAWWLSLAQAVLEVRYDKLKIHTTNEAQDSATVSFTASGMSQGERVFNQENSLFVREEGRWLYRGER